MLGLVTKLNSYSGTWSQFCEIIYNVSMVLVLKVFYKICSPVTVTVLKNSCSTAESWLSINRYLNFVSPKFLHLKFSHLIFRSVDSWGIEPVDACSCNCLAEEDSLLAVSGILKKLLIFAVQVHRYRKCWLILIHLKVWRMGKKQGLST